MKSFFIIDTTGKIIRTGTCMDTDVPKTDPDGVVVHGVGKLDHQYDTAAKVMNPPVSATLWQTVRLERNQLILLTAQPMSDLLLPDSYPKLSAIAKQAKIDAFIKYRQALRDITNQPDPANITWPTPPGAI